MASDDLVRCIVSESQTTSHMFGRFLEFKRRQYAISYKNSNITAAIVKLKLFSYDLRTT